MTEFAPFATWQVQLTLLTAIVKLFLKKPSETQELVQQVLSLATQVRQAGGRPEARLHYPVTPFRSWPMWLLGPLFVVIERWWLTEVSGKVGLVVLHHYITQNTCIYHFYPCYGSELAE